MRSCARHLPYVFILFFMLQGNICGISSAPHDLASSIAVCLFSRTNRTSPAILPPFLKVETQSVYSAILSAFVSKTSLRNAVCAQQPAAALCFVLVALRVVCRAGLVAFPFHFICLSFSSCVSIKNIALFAAFSPFYFNCNRRWRLEL